MPSHAARCRVNPGLFRWQRVRLAAGCGAWVAFLIGLFIATGTGDAWAYTLMFVFLGLRWHANGECRLRERHGEWH